MIDWAKTPRNKREKKYFQVYLTSLKNKVQECHGININLSRVEMYMGQHGLLAPLSDLPLSKAVDMIGTCYLQSKAGGMVIGPKRQSNASDT